MDWMRQVPLEHDISIDINGLSWWRLRTKNEPFTSMFISRSKGTCRIDHSTSILSPSRMKLHDIAVGPSRAGSIFLEWLKDPVEKKIFSNLSSPKPLSSFRIQPNFEDENSTTVSGKIGESVDLDCNIFMLQDYTVSPTLGTQILLNTGMGQRQWHRLGES